MTQADDTKSRIQKVLIVEDNSQTLELMKKFFSKARQRGDIVCDILEGSDGEQAIKMLVSEEPDLIICDIGLPRTDGYGVLKFYNDSYKKSHPFCFFTFLTASQEERKHAFESSVMGFLAKTEMNYFVLTLQIKTWLRLSFLERHLEIGEINQQLEE
ncbi:MAG: response regulator [Deltaproteobacteria bacterium]|nr:response regulator [Deltaproteobacteria bacterium]